MARSSPPGSGAPLPCNEACHVYLATGLSDAEAETDEHERIDIETRPLSELDALIDEVRDAKTLIGLLELHRRV